MKEMCIRDRVFGERPVSQILPLVLGVQDGTPVKVAVLQAVDQHLGSGNVGGKMCIRDRQGAAQGIRRIFAAAPGARVRYPLQR